MKFNVLNIESYSERANKLTLAFTNDVPGIPEGFSFHIFTPKSVNIELGVSDIPFWIAKNIWFGYNEIISKNIGKYAWANAAKGNKKAAKTLAMQAFQDAQELNVEVQEVFEEVGKYIGNAGDRLLDEFKVVDCVSTKSYTSDRWTHRNGYWVHPYITKCMWKLEDRNGNIFMCSSGGDALNSKFDQLVKTGEFVLINAYISDHAEFKGVKQTWLSIRSNDIKEK